MIPRPEIAKSRTTENKENTVEVDGSAADIQRGFIKKPEFFGDHSQSSAHQSFSTAVGTAIGFASSILSLKSSVVDQRDPDQRTFQLTTNEYADIQKKARSIASYGNIPEDVCEDFLLILCLIDNVNDLKKISNGVEIDELNDSNLIHNVPLILSVPHLEKIAYMASAVEGLVNMFRKYLGSAATTDNSPGESVSSILNSLSSILGGIGGSSVAARLSLSDPSEALGNFMSELVTGKRIPMTVIAKNPALQSPSYAGKAFFGEGPTALSNVDIDQLFNKKIGCFPRPSNGAGTTSFGFQNSASLSGELNISQLATKVLFGGSTATPGSKKERLVQQAVDKLTSLSGATTSEILDLRRADTAIPMISAISAVVSGTDKSIFSIDTYASGWKLSNSISNYLQNTNSQLFNTLRRFG